MKTRNENEIKAKISCICILSFCCNSHLDVHQEIFAICKWISKKEYIVQLFPCIASDVAAFIQSGYLFNFLSSGVNNVYEQVNCAIIYISVLLLIFI